MKTKLLSAAFLALLFNYSNAQIDYSQNFEDEVDWTLDPMNFNIDTLSDPCEGESQIGASMWGLLGPSSVTQSGSLGTSDGGVATLSFDYKLITLLTTPAQGIPNDLDWGSIVFEYSDDEEGPWTEIGTITPENHVGSAACATKSFDFTPPSGAVYLKLTANVGEDNLNAPNGMGFFLLVDAITVSQEQLGSEDLSSGTFSFYPNPVNDVLNLSYKNAITAVKVTNVLGQQVLAKDFNATAVQLDMSALSTGTYLVNVTSEGTSKAIKVVK